jgi:hypothetical protein
MGARHSFRVRFNIGDTVRNKITHEEGRIVRIADLIKDGVAYIVSIVPYPNWSTSATEVLWRESEVTKPEVQRVLS